MSDCRLVEISPEPSRDSRNNSQVQGSFRRQHDGNIVDKGHHLNTCHWWSLLGLPQGLKISSTVAKWFEAILLLFTLREVDDLDGAISHAVQQFRGSPGLEVVHFVIHTCSPCEPA